MPLQNPHGAHEARRAGAIQRLSGTVRWFNEAQGVGAIRADDGRVVAVSYRAIRGVGYRSLEHGDRVEFAMGQGPRGPRAEDVSVGLADR
jgi:cold shock protein